MTVYRPVIGVNAESECVLTTLETNQFGPSSIDYQATGRHRDVVGGLSPATWGKLAVIAGLFVAVFWPNLRRLWLKTNPFTGEANWGHAIVVPAVGLYYLFVHREALFAASERQFVWDRPLRRSRLWAGLALIACAAAEYGVLHFRSGNLWAVVGSVLRAAAVLGVLVVLLDWSISTTLFGLLMFAYGIWPGQNDYLKDLGMVVTLFGVVLLTCGRDVMRTAWFPIAFLICALPWPPLVYSWVAEPLQVMAAHVAVAVLQLTGVDAITSGTKIVMHPPVGSPLPDRVLNVAEACAGMRSLMTFVSLGGAIAFLSDRPLWKKLFIMASAVPIAIFCNVMRISGQGLLDRYASQQFSEGFAHQFVGLVMLIPALFLILLVGWVLDKAFIEVADDDIVAAVKPAAPPTVLTRQATVLVRPAAAQPISSAVSPRGRTTTPLGPVEPVGRAAVPPSPL